MGLPIVLLDADGVLLNFQKRYAQEIEDITGYVVKPEDVTEWAMNNCAFFKDLEKEWPGLKSTLNARTSKKGWGSSLEPYPAAVEMMPRLMRVAEVHIVTSPWRGSETWTHERDQVLKRHFDLNPVTQIHHSGNKKLFYGDVFVDDRPKNVMEWDAFWRIHHKGAPEAVLFRATHERPDDFYLHVLCSTDWDFIIDEVL